MMMVIHHVKNLDLVLKEINRILKMGGGLYIKEHDAFTDADKMLVDIEHAKYEIVRRNNKENFYKKYYCKCFDYIERDLILKHLVLKRFILV